ncbi:MAG: YdgA family protein [Gammaproteobacteria bacterium]|nr:YdgA family protein [Gammaproteobacteria bacterium]
MSTKKVSLVEILLWFFVVLLAVLIASPFALGFKIQNDYSLMLNNLSRMMQVDMRIARYDRGYFSSSVILELQLPNAPETIQLSEEIIHGPVYLGLLNQGKSPLVAAVVKGKILSSAEMATMVQQMFSGQQPLVYQAIIDFTGNLDVQGYMPPVNATIPQDAGVLNVQSSGMGFNQKYSSVNGTVTGEINMPSFNLIEADTDIAVRGVNISFHGNMGQNDLMMGDSVISLTSLDIKSAGEQFAMHNVNLRSMASEHGVLVDSQAQLNVREIYASNQQLGPVAFNFSVNGLNANSIKQVQAAQKEIEAKIQQGIPPEQINAMMAGQLMGLLPDMFKQAEIKIKPLSIQSEMGALEANLDLSVDGLDTNTPADPLFMLNAIKLDVDFSVDEALMRQLVEWQIVSHQEQLQAVGSKSSQQVEAGIELEQKVTENLQGMLDENWLKFADGIYKSQISLHQGLMTLNDKSVDPMQQIMSQMAPTPSP